MCVECVCVGVGVGGMCGCAWKETGPQYLWLGRKGCCIHYRVLYILDIWLLPASLQGDVTTAGVNVLADASWSADIVCYM